MLKLASHTDPCLSAVAPAVALPLDAATIAACGALLATLEAQGANALALAAPQVGLNLRAFAWRHPQLPLVLLNPVVLMMHDGQEEAEEGCLSFPGARVAVTRPTSISLGWTNLDESAGNADLTGLWARCALHELDHLNGVTIMDRVPAADREKLLAALTRRLRRNKGKT